MLNFGFQVCCKGLQGFFDNISSTFQGCFIHVSRVFIGCIKGDSRMLQGCRRGVSKVIQGCFNCVWKMFQGRFKDNSIVVYECFKGVFMQTLNYNFNLQHNI